VSIGGVNDPLPLHSFLVTYRVAVLPPAKAHDLSSAEFEDVLCDMLDREDTRPLEADEDDPGVIRAAFEVLGAHDPEMAGAPAPGRAAEIDFTAAHDAAFDPPAADDADAARRFHRYLSSALGVGQYDGPWYVMSAEVHPRPAD
jgi:hypothetical protein